MRSVQARRTSMIALLAATTACTETALESTLKTEQPESIRQALDGSQGVDGYFPAPTTFILAPGNVTPSNWRYTFTQPSGSWTSTSYNDSGWPSGQPGFGADPMPGDVVRTAWNTSNIWLRRTFTLTADQIPRVVFWSRWDDIVDIYVNGHLAASTERDVHSNPYQGWTPVYRYLGMSEAARNSLIAGTNVIAARVRDEGGGRYFDLGLSENPVYDLPVTGTQATPAFDAVTEYVRKYMVDNVIPGGALAIIKENKVVLTRGFGYADKHRTQSVPADSIFRLASVDKALTQNAVRRLIARGFVDPVTGETLSTNTRVFPMLAAWGRGLTLLPGRSLPEGINDITIQQIMDTTSGMRDYPDAETLYQATGTNADTFTIVDGVRYMYSTPLATVPGTVAHYISNGHMILRYLVHELVGDFESHMQKSMLGPAGSHDVIVARQRLEDRSPREIWYATVEELNDRWIGLDEFYALSTSAVGLARYARYYDIDGDVFVDPNTGLWTAPPSLHTRQSGGVMGGSWAFVKQRMTDQFSVALLFNIGGYFDPAAHHIDDMTASFGASAWGLSGPPLAHSPSATVEERGVSTTPTLSWVAGTGATAHDVYFGTSYPLTFRGTQSATQFSPGALDPETTYYWRIDEKNSSGTREGTVWSFTTAGATGLFSDDFEAGAGAWSPHAGNWQVVSDGTQVYRQWNSSGTATASAGSSGWTDQRLTVRVKPLAWNGSNRYISVFTRFQNPNSAYAVLLRSNGRLELRKIVNGVSTLMAWKAFPVSTNTWYTVGFEAIGHALGVTVNGVSQFFLHEGTLPSGKVGVGTYYARAAFDDVVVTP